MARFSFSVAGRKKEYVPPPLPPSSAGPRMSKAHRILGSLPLNIDSPTSWDDASSSLTSDDGSATTAAADSESELRGHEYDEHQVVIAKSDEDWGEEPDVIRHPLRLNAVNFEDLPEQFRTGTTAILKKSRSSSTVRSWYDKSKLPLSISQYASSATMANGFTSNLQPRSSRVGVEAGSKTRKKPAKLDLSWVNGVRRRDSNTDAGLNCNMRSPSILSSFSTNSTRSRKTSMFQRRHTKEGSHSPIPEAPRPVTSRSNQLGAENPQELPLLYDHYEKMSLRRVMRQTSTPSLRMTEDGALTLDVVKGPSENHEDEVTAPKRPFSVLQTPKSTIFPEQDLQSSPDRNSEDDDVEHESTLMRPSVSASLDKLSNKEANTPPLDACGSKPSQIQPGQSTKQSKRTSFAAPVAYTPIPDLENDHGAPAAMNSSAETSSIDLSREASPSKTAVVSHFAAVPTVEWLGKPGCGIQHACLDIISKRSQQDMILFYDDSEPSPDLSDIQDWESATSATTSVLSPDALPAISRLGDQASGKQALYLSETEDIIPPFICPKSSSRSNVPDEASNRGDEMASDDEDFFTPHSPISPDAFPAVPAIRTTLSNMAPLSAVGLRHLGPTRALGWWGDDD
ncbi:hypothetical protein ED733_006857 [Metarhizium rileyi]|uniref:Uncharacterized protein n=1 Tax=Metarhizium rileyi (strain RCEF 4871) TaxID=1649241 RepID=A0A5C6GG12_METRR|nr:hypothetical protein ED733_006857 [Metarhizium rileyi]